MFKFLLIMASQVIFDMADPGVKATVDGWADNTEYEVTMTVRTGTGPNRNVSEVVSMDAEATEPEVGTEEVAEEAPAPKSEKSIPPIPYKK